MTVRPQASRRCSAESAQASRGSSVAAYGIAAGSIIDRLEAAADSADGVRFVGASVDAGDGPEFVSWRQIHDEARAVGAALQARGLVPGDHVAILGPTAGR